MIVLTASFPCIKIRNNFTGFEPRYRVRVSDISPVTESSTLLRSTPFCQRKKDQLFSFVLKQTQRFAHSTCKPIFKNEVVVGPTCCSRPLVVSTTIPPSVVFISTMHKVSAGAGNACILNRLKQSYK